MKTTELMIGDIVMAHYDDGETQCYFPSMVIAIFVDRLLCNDGVQIKSISSEYSDFCDEDCINIEHIQLTAEILEKNGFDIHETLGEWCPKINGFSFVNGWVDDPLKIDVCGFVLEIRYVHELQHALRLCGLDKIADNFKI